MAIQLPNPGLGDGQTGDNEYVMWQKTRDNFNNSTHAASRLVGTNKGNVMEVGAFGIGGTGFRYNAAPDETRLELGEGSTLYNFLGTGLTYNYTTGASGDTAFPEELKKVSTSGFVSLNFFDHSDFTVFYRQGRLMFANGHLFTQQITRDLEGRISATWGDVYAYYHTGNTTKDTATGFLKASSPVLHVYNDSITKIHEAEQLDITVDKRGVGHYEIHGTTGLRKNDGWFMSPPRDVHGNVLCMVDLEEKDGVVILRTYKKKFDFETVSIVHDYDNPMDIPEGVCVEFRFNDLPQEQLDEPAI